MNPPVKYFDVIIIGAGPSGTACALALKGSGLSVAMIDKSIFPRDKVCGDAIGSRVRNVLREIDPLLEQDLESFEKKVLSKGWNLFAPGGKSVSLSFVNYGYVSARADFDNFLFNKVKALRQVTVIENTRITAVNNTGELMIAECDDGTYSCKLVIGCDGANSVARKLAGNFSVDTRHHSGAVRAYFQNVGGTQSNIIEIHLSKKFLPGYFWIFPLNENISNAGFGMLSSDISKRKIDLKKSFFSFIESSAELKARFASAEIKSELKGFGLPLGGKKRKISGERFMLCGDAASLIDPLNGEGIGNGMYSGMLAAKTALGCFRENNFSGNFISSYDAAVYKKLLPELKQKLFLQRLFNRPWLINAAVSAGSRNKYLREWLGKKL